MRGRRSISTFLLLVLTGMLTQPALAVTVDWNDLTDAQQEAAYKSLESEVEALRRQIGAGGSSGQEAGGELEQGTGSGSAAGKEASGGPGQAGTGPSVSQPADEGQPDNGQSRSGQAASSQVKDTAAFLADLAQSFAQRQEEAASYSQDQLSGMSAEDLWSYRFTCAEAERDFYNRYRGAAFDSLNLVYLCQEYCGGLGKQYQAEETWKSDGDADKTSQLYTAGYYNRAYALVELHDYYQLDLGDGYQTLKDSVARMDAATGEETRNAQTDAQTVTEVQELLNRLDFRCGSPDGICGRQTTSCIERFQTMYGYSPADGLIDADLLSQLRKRTEGQGG